MTAKKLASSLLCRAICVYRDGRHYVPLFVPGAGEAVDELAPVVAALRACETAREALTRFAALKADDGDDFGTLPPDVVLRCEITTNDLQAARAALAELEKVTNG